MASTTTVTGGNSTQNKINADGSVTTTVYDSNGKVLSSSISPNQSNITSTTKSTIEYGLDYAKDTTGKWNVFDNSIMVICHVNGMNPMDIVNEWKYLHSGANRTWAQNAGEQHGVWTETNKNGILLVPITDIPDELKKISIGIVQPDLEKTGKIVSEDVKLVNIEGKKGVVKTTIHEDANGNQITVVVNTAAGTKSKSPVKKPDGLANLINIINSIGTISSVVAGIKSFTSTNSGSSASSSSLTLITDSSGQSYLVDSDSIPPDSLKKINSAVSQCNDVCCGDSYFSYSQPQYDLGCSLTNFTSNTSQGNSLIGSLSMFNKADGPAEVLSSIDWAISALDYSTLEPHAGEGDNGRASFANCIPKMPSFASLLSKLGKIDIPKLPTLPALPGIPDIGNILGDLLPTMPTIPTLPEIAKMLGLDNLKCPPDASDVSRDNVSILKAANEYSKAKYLFDKTSSGNIAMNVVGVLMAQQCTNDSGGGRIDPITGKPIFDQTPEAIKSRCVNNMETLNNLKSDINKVQIITNIVANASDNPAQALVNYDLLQKNQYNYMTGTPYTPSSLQLIANAITRASDSTCIFGSFADDPLQALIKYDNLQAKQTQQAAQDLLDQRNY